MHIGRWVTASLVVVLTSPLSAQQTVHVDTAAMCAQRKNAATDHATMEHAVHAMLAMCPGPVPTEAGQAAFAAIREIVHMLDADPRTDWSRVNIEALRQHLIDMDDVTMHAVVAQRDVPGGIAVTVSGAGHTIGAIQRMVVNHARALDAGTEYSAAARESATGALLTITSNTPGDARAVARIRGLGFAGLMTEGDHHAVHHLALARGEMAPHGK